MLVGSRFLKLQKSAIYETLQSTLYSVVKFASNTEVFFYLFHIKLSLYCCDIIKFFRHFTKLIPRAGEKVWGIDHYILDNEYVGLGL